MSLRRHARRTLSIEKLDTRVLLAVDLLSCQPATLEIQPQEAIHETIQEAIHSVYGPQLPAHYLELFAADEQASPLGLHDALPPALPTFDEPSAAWTDPGEGEGPIIVGSQPLTIATFGIEADGDLWILSGTVLYDGDLDDVTVVFGLDVVGSVNVASDGRFRLVTTAPVSPTHGLVSAVAHVDNWQSPTAFATSPS